MNAKFIIIEVEEFNDSIEGEQHFWNGTKTPSNKSLKVGKLLGNLRVRNVSKKKEYVKWKLHSKLGAICT